MGTTQQIESLEGALALVLGSKSELGQMFRGPLASVWFRGHADGSWKLEPGILRRETDGTYLYDEYNMLGEMRLMRPLEAGQYPTTFDWLVMCQHYGLPTRLLDWSESILVGLYFGVQNESVDGALFALSPFELNRRTTLSRRGALCLPTYPDAIVRSSQSVCSSLEEVIETVKDAFGRLPFHSKYIESLGGEKRLREVANLPVAVYPPRNNARIVQQSGMFTLHGGSVPSLAIKADFGEAVSLEESAPVLRRFVIPASAKRQIRIDLQRLGVHYGALFPEFESQSRHLRDKWTRR